MCSMRRRAAPAPGPHRGAPATRLGNGRRSGLDASAVNRADSRECLRDGVHAAAPLAARAVAGRQRRRGNPATGAARRRGSDLGCGLHRGSSWSCTPILHQRSRARIRGVYGLAAVGIRGCPDALGRRRRQDGSCRRARVQLVASRPFAPGPPRSRRTDSRRPTARVHRHLTGTRRSTDAGLRASPDVAIPARA